MELDKKPLMALKTPLSGKALEAPSFLSCPLEKVLVCSLAGGHLVLEFILGMPPFEMAHYTLN